MLVVGSNGSENGIGVADDAIVVIEFRHSTIARAFGAEPFVHFYKALRVALVASPQGIEHRQHIISVIQHRQIVAHHLVGQQLFFFRLCRLLRAGLVNNPQSHLLEVIQQFELLAFILGTEPYTIEQMRFLVQSLNRIENPQDRAYLALHALHPLRLEEVLGLKEKDIDLIENTIHIERAVTHPARNQPLIKDTKTEASRRTINLVPQIIPYLPQNDLECFVLGGDSPLTYTQVRRMCERIQRDTGFDKTISPRRFRTTVLTDLYDTTKDIKQAQAAAGHTTAAMTLKHYVKGRHQHTNTATPIASVYGLEN